MEIYLDLENTLYDSKKTLSIKAKRMLETLLLKHSITILTTAPFCELKDLCTISGLRIVSTIENKVYQNESFSYPETKLSPLSSLILHPAVYTAYGYHQDTCYILSYQERLKQMYAAPKLAICTTFPKEVSSCILAVYNEQYEEIKLLLQDYHLETIATDRKRTLLLVTSEVSTKEAWLLKLKKSPALGLGDSLSDYDFIKHCEIQAAMQNADPQLQALCSYTTELSDSENGALEFIQQFLKHQQA